jgi:peroxiredoxin
LYYILAITSTFAGKHNHMEVGQKAPEVVLYNTDKQKVDVLHSQEGKSVLLLFFPLAFTSVCTTELCSIRDNIAMYNNINAQVYGISVDSPYTLGKFKEEQHLNFPLLSDFNREVSKNYDVLYDTFGAFELQGVSKRAAFVIDKEGTIQYAEVCPSAKDLPNFGAINEVLTQLNG